MSEYPIQVEFQIFESRQMRRTGTMDLKEKV